MTLSSIDAERMIRQRAPSVARAFRDAAAEAHNEQEFRYRAANAIASFASDLGIELPLRQEYTLVTGRADAVYNRFIIEYEPPNSLRASNSSRTNQHAIDQVRQYIQGLSERERRSRERVAGVATDGTYFIFVRHRQEGLQVEAPVRITPSSTERFLRYLTVLRAELPLTPDSLLERFGQDTDTARRCVSTLYAALRSTDDRKVHVLFRQWQRLFNDLNSSR